MMWSIIQNVVIVAQLFLSVVQTVALIVTAIILGLYTRETYKLRKETGVQTNELQQANTFSAITRVNERLTRLKNYKIRGYLHAGFMDHLVAATREVLGLEYVSEHNKSGTVNIRKVLSDLREDSNKVVEFNTRLDLQPALFRGVTSIDMSALDAVEQTLMHFDMIALPYSLKIESAEKLAQAYEPVLRRTASAILPFVAIQLKLRGSNDPGYKRYYLYLLERLGIPLQGIRAPEDPWAKKYMQM